MHTITMVGNNGNSNNNNMGSNNGGKSLDFFDTIYPEMRVILLFIF